MSHSQKRLSSAVLFLYVYTLVIILWGAWVRISGSGNGCGEHWPLCQGEMLPTNATVATYIEFFHRIKSGLYGILILILTIFTFKKYPSGHLFRRMSVLVLLFTFLEAAIGAKLVLLGLVGDNQSGWRAVIMALHQVNSLLLAGALAIFYTLSRDQNTTFRFKNLKPHWPLIAAFLLLATLGSISSLSSTLFPSHSLQDGIIKDFTADSHWLIRSRLWHPVLAVGLSAFFILQWVKLTQTLRSQQKFYSLFLFGSVFGMVMLVSLSPTWMKLGHLLIAHLIWLFLLQMCMRKAAT